MRISTLRKTRLAAALLTLVTLPAFAAPGVGGGSGGGGGGGPTPDNASTTLTISPTPIVLSGDASPDGMADTSTTSATLATATIDEGKIDVEMATSLGEPSLSTAPDVDWIVVPPGNINPVDGLTSTAVDFDGLGMLPGMTASFRAHYKPGGGQVHGDEHKSPVIDVTATGGATCQGFNISADFASGDGDPAPGSMGPWAFRITLENCSGVDLAGIKAQGGSNGWAPAFEWVQSKGSVVQRKNNKNDVLTWTLDMPTGSTETLLVKVDGKIPAPAICDSIRYLSGPWSAVYDAGAGSQKSEYTGRVSVQVTCPAP